MPILVFLGLIKIRELSKKYVYFILFHSLILINISLFIYLRKKRYQYSILFHTARRNAVCILTWRY
jgi:hypothetical protein